MGGNLLSSLRLSQVGQEVLRVCFQRGKLRRFRAGLLGHTQFLRPMRHGRAPFALGILTLLWKRFQFRMAWPRLRSFAEVKWEAITFDVGGTLIEPHPSVGHVYSQVASETGLGTYSPEQLNRQFLAAWGQKRPFDYSKRSWLELVRQTFLGLSDPFLDPDFFDRLYDRFARAEVWRVYSDVLPVLEILHQQGVKLAAISNWDERLGPLMRDLDLSRFFQVITISVEVGCHKPDPQVFLGTLQKLGATPERTLHVGDQYEEDYLGAIALGMEARLLQRGQQVKLRDTACIQTLTELISG